jgi:lysozyme family protein
MPDKIWEEIYKTLYWDAIKGDTIKNQGIANLMVDFAWGAGPGTAIRKMQEVLNDQFLKKIPTTSVMGPLTLAAVNKVDTVKLGAYYQAIKLKYYLVDIPGDANDKGWKKRLDDLYNQSIEFIKKNPTTFGVAAFGVVAGLTTVFF